MQAPTLEQVRSILNGYAAQAKVSPAHTVSGHKIITSCRIDNMPDNIKLQRFKHGLETAFAQHYPRANPFAWSGGPSPQGAGRIFLNISFKNSVDDLAIRKLLAKECRLELQLSGHDFRDARLSYGSVLLQPGIKPLGGDAPPALP